MSGNTYAGIGSRKTPVTMRLFMTRLAEYLRQSGWYLRSGGAEGADAAFEAGASNAASIFLPWRGYNDQFRQPGSDVYDFPSHAARVEASRHHPAWEQLGDGAKLLHARNTHIVLGYDLRHPVSRVICWTPDGKETGGTAQAMRLARRKMIPIHNLHNPQVLKYYQRMMR